MTDKQMRLLRAWLTAFVQAELVNMKVVHGQAGKLRELERKLWEELYAVMREDRLSP